MGRREKQTVTGGVLCLLSPVPLLATRRRDTFMHGVNLGPRSPRTTPVQRNSAQSPLWVFTSLSSPRQRRLDSEMGITFLLLGSGEGIQFFLVIDLDQFHKNLGSRIAYSRLPRGTDSLRHERSIGASHSCISCTVHIQSK